MDNVRLGGEDESSSGADISALREGLFGNYRPNPVTASASSQGAAPDGPGQASVDLARRFEGELSQDVKGQLPHFQAAGGNTNNCADFVSSLLQATGRGVEQTPRVNELREQLLEKGWSAIPPEEARPGDVWMTESDTYGSRHTELVSQADGEGGFHTIGSNNISEGQQQIFEREKTGGVIYGYREPPVPTPNPHR